MEENKEIKRVLWLEDNPEVSDAKKLFDMAQTENFITLDDVLDEFSTERLYHYDTILLDIDMENAINDTDEVKRKLLESGGIYLDDEKIENYNKITQNSFLHTYGGYLAYLYLLVKGYPREQIAFLTANYNLIAQNNTDDEIADMTPEEISELFEKAYNDHVDQDTKQLDAKAFEKVIKELQIKDKFKDEELYQEWVRLYEEGEKEEYLELLVKEDEEQKEVKADNTGDTIISLFHQANIEPPLFFSKDWKEPSGHNMTDAREWLKNRSSDDNITRWLILCAGDYVEQQFSKNNNILSHIQNVFTRSVVGDGGIRSAFRNMYFVFDGLKARNNSTYYQAISAMLMPFGNTMIYSNPRQFGDPTQETEAPIQARFGYFAKQARNYCAHNYFGNEISNATMLFLISGVLCTILCDNQLKDIKVKEWFEKAHEIICKKPIDTVLSVDVCCDKVSRIRSSLSRKECFNERINEVKEIKGNKNLGRDMNAEEQLCVLGWIKSEKREAVYDKRQQITAEDDVTSVKERYYRFILAAHVIKALMDYTENDIPEAIKIVGETARYIVSKDYTYFENTNLPRS